MEAPNGLTRQVSGRTHQSPSHYLSRLSPLSETLWKNVKKLKPHGIATAGTESSAWLTWKDLTVRVSNGRGEIHPILENVSGYAEPCYMTAIMGPSGSGKSTLLDALAGTYLTTFNHHSNY